MEPTDAGLDAVQSIMAKPGDRGVNVIVARTALALPGMSERCGCKRFRETAVAP